MLHEGSNNAASLAERLEVHENLTFPHTLWINNDKSNKTTRTRTTYILKMLYRGCSMKEAISRFPYHLFHFPRSHGVIMIDQSYISFQRTLRRMSFLSRVIDAVMYCIDLGIQKIYQTRFYHL